MPLSNLVVVLAVAVISLGLSDAPPRFHGLATVEIAGAKHHVAFRSEDLPGEGFKNRFRFVLMAAEPLPLPELRQESDYVTVTACADGSMLAVFHWGRITFRAMDRLVKQTMARAAPGSETLKQFVTTTRKDDNVIEIMVEEPEAALASRDTQRVR